LLFFIEHTGLFKLDLGLSKTVLAVRIRGVNSITSGVHNLPFIITGRAGVLGVGISITATGM